MPVTGDGDSIEAARAALRGYAASSTTFFDTSDEAGAQAQQVWGEARGLVGAADHMRAGLDANQVDRESQAEVAAMGEQAGEVVLAAHALTQAAAAVGVSANDLLAGARAALDTLNAGHSTLEEARLSTPRGGAVKGWYEAA